MDTLAKLQVIFRDIFDDSSLVISRDTSALDIEDWDSLAQINIVSACETLFGVKFEIPEIIGLGNVGDLVDTIESKK